MATIKAYTGLPQSKTLIKILPLESADMRYHTIPNCNPYPCDEIVYTIDFGKPSTFHVEVQNQIYKDIPCWSLAALLSILPQSVRLVGTPKDSYWYCECDNGNNQWRADFKSADNPVDACVEMIEKLHELNLL